MTADAPATTPLWAAAHPLGAAEPPGAVVHDVVVVGAGLAGCSTALHLAEQRPDLTVALLDAQYPASGASGRGTGLLGPRQGPPVDVARRRLGDPAARQLYRQSERAVARVLALAARWAPAAVTPCAGQLVLGSTRAEQATVRRRARAYAELGLDVPLVAAGGIAAPADPSAPALFHRLAAGVDPAALTRGLALAARSRGVWIGEQVAVVDIQPEPDGLTRLRASRGMLLARAVVVTVDAAAPGLSIPMGGLLPLEVCAQATEVLPADLLAELGGPGAAHVLSASALGGYRRITPEGRLVIGGGPVTPWRGMRPDQLARSRQRAWDWQRAWLAGTHPRLDRVRVDHRWSGRITVTRDGLPVLGRVPGPGEVWYAGGWNGHGLAATVDAGAHLAASVLRTSQPGDGDLWQPGRAWLLAHRALRPVVHRYLATQVPRSRARETAVGRRNTVRSEDVAHQAGREARGCP